MPNPSVCWCGNRQLIPFSDDYLRCPECETLILRRFPAGDPSMVGDEENDLYGRNYFERHLPNTYGYPEANTRARSDLTERCLFWLRTLLCYKEPKGELLELGCFHGGFVALSRLAGFTSRGLELSPSVCELARQTFDIDVLCGPMDQQNIPNHSLEVVALFDVLEHLVDPLESLKRYQKALRPKGVIIVQTPCYPEGRSYEEMLAQSDPFLSQFKPLEHLYLFSRKSLQKLCIAAGLPEVVFEPAIFAHYDMFAVIAPTPPILITPDERDTRLLTSASGRILVALLDFDRRATDLHTSAAALKNERNLLIAQLADLQNNFAAIEEDRAARAAVIVEQGKRLINLETEFGTRLQELNALFPELDALKNERNLLQAQLADLRHNFDAVEEDRAARAAIIAEQGCRLVNLEAEFDTRLKELHALYPRLDDLKNERNLLQAQLADLRHNFDALESAFHARGDVIDQQGHQTADLHHLVWLTERNRDFWLAEADRQRTEHEQMATSLQKRITQLDSVLKHTEQKLLTADEHNRAFCAHLKRLESRWWFRLVRLLGLQ